MNSSNPEPTAGRTLPALVPHRRFRQAPSRPRAVPTGLLATLAVVAAVEASVARRGDALTDTVGCSWSFSERAARRLAPGKGILCLGDSLAKHGLAPGVIEAVTGRSTCNLAVAAGPAPATYHLLRRALGAGARPSAVVFDLKPGLMAGGPRFRLKEWPRLLTAGEALGLVRAAGGLRFATELLLNTALPSFRSRHEIRANVLETLRGEPPGVAGVNALAVRHWSANAGGHLAAPRVGYNGEVSEAEHREHLSHGFKAHRVNALYARRLVALADSCGARTYLLIPPFAPGLRARRLETGADAGYDAFVRSLQARAPGLVVLDARASGYPASVFIDPIHLDARGASALSAAVAGALTRDEADPAQGRWVKLSPYRPTPLPAGSEDVEQTRARLKLKLKTKPKEG
jgi:hypothetical protein